MCVFLFSAQGVSVGFHRRSHLLLIEGWLPLSTMASQATQLAAMNAALETRECVLCFTEKSVDEMTDRRCKQCRSLRARILRMKGTMDDAEKESAAKLDLLTSQDRAQFYKADS